MLLSRVEKRRAGIGSIFGESEMAVRVRAFDWAGTPLGPIESWPQSLLTAASICLTSRFPMFLWWGPLLVTLYNDAYIPLLGARHPEALGRPAHASWNDVWSQVGPQVDLVLNQAQATWNERVLLRTERHGFPEEAWFTWSYSPIRDESGKVGGLFCAVTEDTPRVLAERQRDQLAEEQRLAQARDHFLVRVDDATRRLSDPNEIMLANATLLGQHLGVDRCAYAEIEADEDTMNLTGNYRRSEAVASIIGRLKFRDFGAEVLQLMRDELPYVVEDVESHQPPVGNLAAYRATQIRSVICVPLHKGGKFAAAMAVHCMTPRKWEQEEIDLVLLVAARCWESLERARAEATLRASEVKLKEADRRKDEFLAMLAHELRNPLAPISNALHALRLSADPSMAQQAREVMERQVRLLVRLVDDLLDVSRITRGKVALKKEAVSLSVVVGAALETMMPLLEQRSQSLRVSLPEDVWLDADRARLAQVFANILHNASKFTQAHGTIGITARREAGGVTVEIRDDGIGIPREQLASIFDMFSQVDNSLERSQGGLGIGLTIVKSLLEMHGGRVEAASDGLGKGTTLRVHLPTRTQSGAAAAGEVPPAGPDAAALRLLVVDDNRDSARTLGTMLQLLGHEVHLEYDGEAALQAATRLNPDAVFLDIGMPGMNGFEVCRRLKAAAPSRGMVVIAQTGWGDPAHRVRSQEAGFDHHLVKPVDAEMLKSLLGRIVPGSQ